MARKEKAGVAIAMSMGFMYLFACPADSTVTDLFLIAPASSLSLRPHKFIKSSPQISVSSVLGSFVDLIRRRTWPTELQMELLTSSYGPRQTPFGLLEFDGGSVDVGWHRWPWLVREQDHTGP